MTEVEWKRFREMKNEDIDTSDIPELDERFWTNAKLVIPPNKMPVSLRVDKDVLAWFKAQGKGYQSLMNAVLRSYVSASDKKVMKSSAKDSAAAGKSVQKKNTGKASAKRTKKP